MARSLAAAALVVSLAAAACSPPPKDAVTDMASAARTGDTLRIAALAAAGHDVNRADPGLKQWTPLLHAIHKGQRGSIEALIAAGADVNRTAHHFSPLEMAAGNGQADIVRRLLAAGADPREPGVFTAAVSGGALTDIERPLLGSCHTDIVRMLLEREPRLRLPRNPVGHLAHATAFLKSCTAVLDMVQFAPRAS